MISKAQSIGTLLALVYVNVLFLIIYLLAFAMNGITLYQFSLGSGCVSYFSI